MIKIDFSEQEINQLNYRRQKLLFRLSLTLCLVSFVLVILMVYSYRREKYQTFKKVHEQAKLTAKNAALEIDKRLIKLKTIVKSLENDLSVGKFNEEQFGKKLKEISYTNPEIWTVGVVYQPFKFDPSLPLYSNLYVNKEGKRQFFSIEDSYDYTQHEWYKQSLIKGEHWLEPFFGDATKALITGFAIPFYRPDHSNQKLGIVIATINLQEIREIVSSLKLGKTGFGFLLSKKGTFISYPQQKYVTEQDTIFDLAKEFNNNEQLRKMGEKAIKGVSGKTIDFIEINEQKVLIFYEPIPSTCSSLKGKKRCWSLGVTFFKDEFFVLSEDTEISKKGDTKSLRRKLIWSSLATVSFLFFLSILIFGAYQGSVRNLWTVSSWFSVLLGVEIGFIIYLSLTEQGQQLGGKNQVLLRGPASLNKYLHSHEQLQKRKKIQEELIHVPTGFFLKYLEYRNSNKLYVTGYIWQKYDNRIIEDYPDVVPKNKALGFFMHQAIEFDVTSYFSHEEDNYKLFGWNFKALLSQNFNYYKFPFDSETVSIQLRHNAFDKNVILVPDFDAYNLISPSSKPGLDKDFAMPGWNIKRSFFLYTTKSDDTNFGIEDNKYHQDFPLLDFRVDMQRDFFNIFVITLVIPMIVVILLFLIQWIAIKKIGENKSITPLDMIRAGSSLVFIMILEQINVRQNITTSGIIYIDFCYFIFYLLILAVVINGALFASDLNIRWIEYKQNLLAKLLFWPSLNILLLIVTLFIFY